MPIRVVTSFLLFLSALTADAMGAQDFPSQETSCENRVTVQAESFKPLVEGLTQIGLPLLATQALVSIGDVETKKSFCSAAYVSDQGHILTAAHCLDRCLFPPMIVKYGEVIMDEEVFMRRPPPSAECVFLINGRETKVRVLLSRSCDQYTREAARREALLAEPKRHLRSDCLDDPDVAILLPKKRPDAFRCLEVDEKNADINVEVVALGVPEKTSRPKGINADGEN